MTPTAALLAALLSTAPDDSVLTASLVTDEVAVGSRGALVVDVRLPGGTTADEAGSPAPFLQLDVPPSVRLAGPYLRTHKELARNEFLRHPYERLLQETPARIEFEWVAAPKEDERIGLNVVAYVRAEGEASFLRQRYELPLTSGAKAERVDATRSDWGADEGLLQIGSKAVPFDLPGLPGGNDERVRLSDHLGKRKVLVTTYRAHW